DSRECAGSDQPLPSCWIALARVPDGDPPAALKPPPPRRSGGRRGGPTQVVGRAGRLLGSLSPRRRLLFLSGPLLGNDSARALRLGLDVLVDPEEVVWVVCRRAGPSVLARARTRRDQISVQNSAAGPARLQPAHGAMTAR